MRQDFMKPFEDELKRRWVQNNLLSKGQSILSPEQKENFINTGKL